MWITPQPSFARLPGIESRSSSSSPALPRSADLVTPKTRSKKSRSKGKGKEDLSSSSSSSAKKPANTNTMKSNNKDNDDEHYRSLAPPPLPHEEDAGPSGFGTANEDYNTLTAEYLEAAQHTGYDNRVKDVDNEGPLVEGSKAWEEAQEEEHDLNAVRTPDYVAVNGADEFSNPWEGK